MLGSEGGNPLVQAAAFRVLGKGADCAGEQNGREGRGDGTGQSRWRTGSTDRESKGRWAWSQFVAMAAGGFYSCGTDTDSEAFCRGDNTYGQIGDGTFGASNDRLVTKVWSATAVAGPS